ncbi:hypothetical protein Goshw_027529 [Gossypium schwendimanii]|uniref:Uncharacterized protein n=1 Tax=Gossypium schwendimanii TaxID=34291 RepID=A0A7J9N6S5_GOSSC|nr:hypothetical protein [Gossypium schwendimanii]
MKILAVSPLTTPKYIWWWERRINDNIPVLSQENVRPIEKHLQEVADHLHTLAVQADVLSLKYESESSRGRELALFLRRVKALSIKAKPYM